MKTRLMTLLLALAMTVSLTACGGNGASSAQGGTSSAQTSADTSAGFIYVPVAGVYVVATESEAITVVVN